MTDFEMHVDVDYTIDSDYHQNGRVEIQITLDEKSAASFYQWLADGCKRDLILNKNGCRLDDPKVNLYNQVRNDLDFAIHYADGIPWSSKEYRDAEQDPKYNELCYWDNHEYPEPVGAKRRNLQEGLQDGPKYILCGSNSESSADKGKEDADMKEVKK